MKKSLLRNLIFILAIGIVSVSCDESSVGLDNSGSATFKGKVETSNNSQQVAGKSSATTTAAQSTTGVKGAVVTAAVVQADGSLEMIGNNQVKTNAEGEYTLKVDLSAVTDVSNRIVIVAKSSGQTTKAFVVSNVQNGETITVQPISLESSAEADVYQQIVANDDADVVSKATIEIAVEADVAANIESNTQAAAKLASALASAAQAKAEFYAQNGIEITNDQRQKIMNISQKAEIQLASKLNAAASAQAKQNAFDAFLKSVANAELDAGVKAWAVAESDDFAANVLLENTTDLSSNARSEIRRYAYFNTAVAINAAAQAQAKALGASDNTINAIADAGAALQSKIESTANASAEVINNAFIQFNEDVRAAVKNDSSLNGNAFVAANLLITQSGGIKSVMETKIETMGNLSGLLGIYSDFSSGVKSIVKSSFTSADDVEVQTYTRFLVLVNLAN